MEDLMKSITSMALALALTLSVVPAVAGDTFQAFPMSAAERALLTPLPDDRLAAIEGARCVSAQRNNPVNIGLEVGIVNQINVCAVCAGVRQTNVTCISQDLILHKVGQISVRPSSISSA